MMMMEDNGVSACCLTPRATSLPFLFVRVSHGFPGGQVRSGQVRPRGGEIFMSQFVIMLFLFMSPVFVHVGSMVFELPLSPCRSLA